MFFFLRNYSTSSKPIVQKISSFYGEAAFSSVYIEKKKGSAAVNSERSCSTIEIKNNDSFFDTDYIK